MKKNTLDIKPIITGTLMFTLFVPIHFLIGVNFNYLLPSVAITLLLITGNATGNVRLYIFFSGVLFISYCTLNMPINNISVSSIFQSPIIAFYILIFIICFFDNSINKSTKKTILYISLLTGVILTIQTIGSGNVSIQGRNRGLGSASYTSIVGVVIFTLGYLKLKKNKTSIIPILLISLGSVLIMMIQARGPIITIAIILVFDIMLSKNKVKNLLFVTILSTLAVLLIIEYMPDTYKMVSLRFQINNDMHIYSSGRSDTYISIYNYMIEKPWSIFFGNGLNSIKDYIYSNQLEFPHNDFLYLFFELGIFGMTIFMYVFYQFLAKLKTMHFRILLITSMLHTNMILMCFVFVVVYLVDQLNETSASN